MLWVLKRTVSMRWFFWAPKTHATNYGKKIFTILRWKFLFIKTNDSDIFYFQLLSQQVAAFGLCGIKCHIYVSGEGEDL